MRRYTWINLLAYSKRERAKSLQAPTIHLCLETIIQQWYFKFHRVVTSNGFTMIEEDHCVYVKWSNGNFLILSLSVDDILLAGNDKEMIVATQG